MDGDLALSEAGAVALDAVSGDVGEVFGIEIITCQTPLTTAVILNQVRKRKKPTLKIWSNAWKKRSNL
jgi:hypothetical protein